jgi:hypothetical protein
MVVNLGSTNEVVLNGYITVIVKLLHSIWIRSFRPSNRKFAARIFWSTWRSSQKTHRSSLSIVDVRSIFRVEGDSQEAALVHWSISVWRKKRYHKVWVAVSLLMRSISLSDTKPNNRRVLPHHDPPIQNSRFLAIFLAFLLSTRCFSETGTFNNLFRKLTSKAVLFRWYRGTTNSWRLNLCLKISSLLSSTMLWRVVCMCRPMRASRGR